jgi:YfiR/HmsC-like
MHNLRLFLSYIIILMPLSAVAKDYVYTDAAVKAAYVLNISHFVNFSKNKFIDLCIIGDDLIGVTIANQQISNPERYERVKISKRESYATLDSCNIVYISAQQSHKLSIILYKTDQLPILTISDISSFAKKGGMIELATVQNKVQMYINHDAVAEHRIPLSSKLLSFAKQVPGE